MTTLVYRAYCLLRRKPNSAHSIGIIIGEDRRKVRSAFNNMRLLGAIECCGRRGKEVIYRVVPGVVVSADGRGTAPASRANLPLGPPRALAKTKRTDKQKRSPPTKPKVRPSPPPRGLYGSEPCELQQLWIGVREEDY